NRRDQLRPSDERFAALRFARAAGEVELLITPALEQDLRGFGARLTRGLRIAGSRHLPPEHDELRKHSHRIPAADVDLLVEQAERSTGKSRRKLLVLDVSA